MRRGRVHYTHVVTRVPITEGPCLSNGSTNAHITEQCWNILCPTNAIRIHTHHFTWSYGFEVGTIKTACASDSRGHVMVEQVCNATSYHYHDGVGQGAGMAQTIIGNTTPMYKYEIHLHTHWTLYIVTTRCWWTDISTPYSGFPCLNWISSQHLQI